MKTTLLVCLLSLFSTLTRGGETNQVVLLASIAARQPFLVQGVKKPELIRPEKNWIISTTNFFPEATLTLENPEPKIPILDDVDILTENGAGGRTGEDTYFYPWRTRKDVSFGPGGKSFYPTTFVGGGKSGFALTFSLRWKMR